MLGLNLLGETHGGLIRGCYPFYLCGGGYDMGLEMIKSILGGLFPALSY